MLARLTSKNQLTLPVEVLRGVPRSDLFDETVEGGTIVLRPVRVVSAIDLEALRDIVAGSGATEEDVPAAVGWARRR